MNKVIMMGRLTGDPEIRHSSGKFEGDVASYTLAVPRGKKGSDGRDVSDFFRCAAFGERANFCRKYLHKGIRIVITGRLKTGSYVDRDGKKVYTTDIIVEEQEFAESKAASESYYTKSESSDNPFRQSENDSQYDPYGSENGLPF